jgi:hypothetical protein
MAKTSKSGILKSSLKLQWLEPLFEELDGQIDRYVHHHWQWNEPEPPYWNNEAASVSMLVAAGAIRGYITLSDYRTDKTKDEKHSNGRCDLYIAKGKDNWLEIEAKQTYAPFAGGLDAIKKRMEEAEENVSCIVGNPGNKAALVLAIAQIEDSECRKTKWVDKFERLVAQVDADFCWIWCDLKNYDRYRWNKETWVHPGLAILLKQC